MFSLTLSTLLSSSPLYPQEHWTEPLRLNDNVNFGGEDYYPSISADGKKLYFTSSSRPGGFGDDDIWVSTWDGTDWGPAVNLGPKINDHRRNLSPSIAPDGEMLYFVSYGREGGLGGYDIWRSRRLGTDTEWTEPENLGAPVNSAGGEWNVHIARDGVTLLISAAGGRPGGHGIEDLWISKWNGERWSEPVNLGSTINTSSREYTPFLAKGGETLYFADWGNHTGSVGDVDIFVVHRDTSGAWGDPVGVSDLINTETWDDGPSLTLDENTMYFASRREPGTEWYPDMDIYVTHRIVDSVDDPQPQYVSSRDSSSGKDDRLVSYPNPFNSSVRIVVQSQISTPYRQDSHLAIFNIAGKLLRRLLPRGADRGELVFIWDGRDENGRPAPSGVYYGIGSVGRQRVMGKLVLLK